MGGRGGGEGGEEDKGEVEDVKEGGDHSFLHCDERPGFLEGHAAEGAFYLIFLLVFILPFLFLLCRMFLCLSQ